MRPHRDALNLKTRWFWCLALCVFCAGCFHPRMIQERSAIRGTVIDSATARPVGAAMVGFDFAGSHFSASSKPDGKFLIPGSRYFDIGFVFDPPSSHPTRQFVYEITVQKEGFQPWNKRFVYASSPSAIALQDVALVRAGRSMAAAR